MELHLRRDKWKKKFEALVASFPERDVSNRVDCDRESIHCERFLGEHLIVEKRMQIEINNENAAQLAAAAAGFPTVEEFVNNLIKRESDLLAINEGLADTNTRSFEEFDKEFRDKNGFKSKPAS